MVLEPWRRSGDEQAGATVSHSDGPGGGHWGPTGGVMVIMQCSSLGEKFAILLIYPVINNIGMDVSFWVIVAIGAVPTWCSTRPPSVTGGSSSSTSRWLPRTMGVACHRAWMAPQRNGLVVAYPGYCCLQSSRSCCLAVHVSKLLLPTTSPIFFCSFRSPLQAS